MCIITGTLKTTRHSTRNTITLHVAHASTKAYGIRCYDTLLVGKIGDYHTVVGAATTVKIERAKINPCASTHLLIDTKQSALTFKTHYILHIRHAVWKGLITHIHSITSCLRNLRLVRSPRLMPLAHCAHLTSSALQKRILAVTIDSIARGKALSLGCTPLLTALILYISPTIIVVYQHLILLPVTLARSIDNSTGTLKHRD